MDSETCCYIVVCREDRQPDGTPGNYTLLTRTVFLTEEGAAEYASGVSPSREPLVVKGRFAGLRFNDGRFPGA